MSLVTRCTTCGTVFRVVQDQLKVSSGWVRCGKCGEVFNALQTLFDLDRDSGSGALAGSPPAAGEGALRSASADGGVGQASGFGPADDPRALVTSRSWPGGRAGGGESGLAGGQTGSIASSTASGLAMPGRAARPGTADAPVERVAPASSFLVSAPSPVDLPISVLPEDRSTSKARDGGSVWPSEGSHSRWIEPDLESEMDGSAGATSDSRQLVVAGAHVRTADAPEFLREDQRRAFWSSPLARGLLSFGALMLAALLLGQAAVHERDRVADLWPASRPLLAQWCRVSGCELLEAPRRLEAFTVESTSLSKAGSAADAYRLSITLRNRAARPATLPSIELSLTDADGQLVSRRALHPTDFRIQRPVVPAGAETTLQLVMTAAKGRVNGYTIEIFYP